MFAHFYDETKSKETNNTESEKARHNRDILQYTTAAVALFTAVAAAALTTKKLYDEFT